MEDYAKNVRNTEFKKKRFRRLRKFEVKLEMKIERVIIGEN